MNGIAIGRCGAAPGWQGVRSEAIRPVQPTTNAARRDDALQICGPKESHGPLERPPQQHRSDRKAGAHGRQQHAVPLLETPAVDCVTKGERDCGSGRIAEPLDVDDDLVRGETQSLGSTLDDPSIGLVRHEQVNVAGGDVVLPKNSLTDLHRFSHRKLEDRGAILLNVVQTLINRFVRRRPQAPTRRHTQRVPAMAVDLVGKIKDLETALIGGRRRDHDGSRAIAKKHARRPVFVVDDRRHHIGAHHQRVFVQPSHDHPGWPW